MSEEALLLHPSDDAPALSLTARWNRFACFLRKKWWVIAGTVLVAAAVQIVLLYTQNAPHSAVARLLVGGKIKIPEGGLFAEEWQNFFGTQIEIMKSDKIRQRVIKRLQALNQNRYESLIQLQISQLRKTTIFVLQATGKDQAYTEAYLNALLDEYLNYKKEVRAFSSDDTLASLTTQFLQKEKELNREQEKLLAFQKTNSLALLQEQGSSAGLSKMNLELADLRLQFELLNGSMDAPGGNGLPESTSSEQSELSSSVKMASGLSAQQQLQMLKFERKEMGVSMRPEHPKMVKLDEEIARGEKLVAIYKSQSQEQLEATRESLKLKIQSVSNAVVEWETKVLNANNRLAEYASYRSNVDRIQSLYDRLLRLLQSVDLDKNVDQENVVIMDRAVPMLQDQSRLKLVLAPFIGLIVGIAIVLFVATADDRFTSIQDLKRGFAERIVGQIPESAGPKKNKPFKLLEQNDSRHSLAESYRNLRSSLLVKRSHKGPARTILVTSAVPDEGKSTVAINLARTLAFSGNKVLLVDADLRTGELHKLLDLPCEPGLTQLEAPDEDFGRLLVPTALPNLTFLSRGKASEKAGELFLSPNIDSLLAKISQEFDWVVLDSAPVFAAADTPSLAPKVDGVLFVIRDFFTRARLAREALDQLYERNSNVLGIVWNRASDSTRGYPYFKYPKYYAAPAGA